MKKVLLLTVLSLVALSSCRSRIHSEMGTLDLRIAEVEEFIMVETKSGVDYTDFSNYDVVIDGPTKYEAKYSEFSGKVVELGSGNYTITVTSPYTEPAAFEQPIYQAHEKFVIKAGEVTPLNLVCTPLNCKVTIELTENFVKELSSYEVVISNGLGELVWTKDGERNDFSETKAGYFLPRGLEIKVKGHRSIDDTEANAVHFVKNPQPAEHHIVKLDAKVTGQIGGVTINVSTEFTNVNQDISVPGMDEVYVDRPDFEGDEGDEEEGESTAPSIVWAENSYFDPITISPSDQISMVINAPEGIKSFVVQVSENFKTAISMVAGGKDYIDLINDSAIWGPLGLPVGDQVSGQTSITFELTPFVPTLCGAAGGQTVSFTLYCTDSKDQELLLDLGDGATPAPPTVTLNVPAASN